MIEGWHNNDYLVLREDEEEALRLTEAYGIRQHLPDCTFVGLTGWDDFILIDAKGKYFKSPTVPVDQKYLEPIDYAVDATAIKPDQRFTKKVKWYVKPIVFGGDPRAKENVVWLSLDQHAEVVRWWNKLYRDTIAKNA